MKNLKVKSLHYYPIKSCKGISVDSAELIETGFKDDRKFMLVDEENVFITQRAQGMEKMALIEPKIQGSKLIVNAPRMSEFSVNILDFGTELEVNIWKDNVKAIDQGDQVAIWLSDYLERKVRLVHQVSKFIRPTNPEYSNSKNDQVSFADGYPLLLTSQKTLDDLNKVSGTNLSIDRFRPNIVIDGLEAWEEVKWKNFSIGEIEFHVAKLCVRCGITGIDQNTGQNLGVSKHLLGLREIWQRSDLVEVRDEWAKKSDSVKTGMIFGINLIHKSMGTIKVGDYLNL